jgi:alpha-mannosidase
MLTVVLPLAAAEAPRRIYIAPDDHTDYMWTADENAYRQAFVDMIDYYLDQADRTAAHRSEHQGRWNCDGSFWMWTYEHSKTRAEFERVLSRVRDGQSACRSRARLTYGGTPMEAVLRGMYTWQNERRTACASAAVAMENQTLPYGLGALWAGRAKFS